MNPLANCRTVAGAMYMSMSGPVNAVPRESRWFRSGRQARRA
jgi:hypothetical protein